LYSLPQDGLFVPGNHQNTLKRWRPLGKSSVSKVRELDAAKAKAREKKLIKAFLLHRMSKWVSPSGMGA